MSTIFEDDFGHCRFAMNGSQSAVCVDICGRRRLREVVPGVVFTFGGLSLLMIWLKNFGTYQKQIPRFCTPAPK